MYRHFFKRFLDIVIAALALIALFPVFLALLIFLTLYYKGSPFFYQERPGYKSKLFSVIKFKSMLNRYDQSGKLLPDIERITKIGYFLRKTSLDEIPQLLNVLKGDMSFIGPRPLLKRYLPYYTEREFKRHDVRPGITGLAQVSGRNYLNWQDRLELDIQYVENLSFKVDASILLKTAIKVIKGSDIKVIPNGTPFDIYRQNQLNVIQKNSSQIMN